MVTVRASQTLGPRGAEEPAASERTKPMRSYIGSSVGSDGAPRLLGADGEQPLQLALVGAKRLEALADRRQAARRPTRRRRP